MGLILTPNESNVLSEVEGLMYIVYIIRTRTNKLYIGHTNNLNRREIQHRHHIYGAKYLRNAQSDFEIVYTETFESRIEAVKREIQLKKWSRAKKEALIAQDLQLLKTL